MSDGAAAQLYPLPPHYKLYKYNNAADYKEFNDLTDWYLAVQGVNELKYNLIAKSLFLPNSTANEIGKDLLEYVKELQSLSYTGTDTLKSTVIGTDTVLKRVVEGPAAQLIADWSSTKQTAATLPVAGTAELLRAHTPLATRFGTVLSLIAGDVQVNLVKYKSRHPALNLADPYLNQAVTGGSQFSLSGSLGRTT